MKQPLLEAPTEQLKESFSRLQTREDVAKLLEVSQSQLAYHLFQVGEPQKYATFSLKKKNGKNRTIAAPITALKIIQRKLNYVLSQVYEPKFPAQGFVRGRSIVTNAGPHVGSKHVLNIDLENFFPSINFGRVRGMFMAKPYSIGAAAATTLAQICCYNNALPQGAPTSPIVANMICGRLDGQLRALATQHRCSYTRYADDITLSTPLRAFPRTLARLTPPLNDPDGTPTLQLGEVLTHIVNANGFSINMEKARLQNRKERQVVTGLTVNTRVNVHRTFVRQIRAMLHAWEKYGYEAAENEFRQRYDKIHRKPGSEAVSFKKVIKGKLDFLSSVRGKHDPVYIRLLRSANLRDNQTFKLTEQAKSKVLSIEDVQKLIWILECDESSKQGSAFVLQDVGLVTCAHVVGPQSVAFQPKNPTAKYPVQIKYSNDTIDLAILTFGAPGEYSLPKGNAKSVQISDVLTIFGFPNY